MLQESCQENTHHRLRTARFGGPLVVANHGEMPPAESQLTVNVPRSQRLHHLSDLNPEAIAGVHDRSGRETDATEELSRRMQQLFVRAIA